MTHPAYAIKLRNGRLWKSIGAADAAIFSTRADAQKTIDGLSGKGALAGAEIVKMGGELHPVIGNRRYCYMIPPAAAPHDARGFVPAIVIEGDDGYHLMMGRGEHAAPWVWGPTREDAEAACKAMNERIGITEAAAWDIIAGSMIKARR